MSISERWHAPEGHFWLHGVRPEAPVAFDEQAGVWNVYGYPETHRILSDPTTFSSDVTRVVPEADEFSQGNLVRLDPPEHTKLRKLVSHAFTPKVVNDLQPRIASLTHELLDALDGQDRMEMVNDLAYPLPVIVIAELLGVPAEDRGLFKQWVDAMFESSSDGLSLRNPSEEELRGREVAVDQVRQLGDYLREHAERRRSRPGADLLTKLVEAEVDGERLTMDEVVNFAVVLLVAGHITTTMLLGNTILCLDSHPEVRSTALADPDTIPAVIEESLRFLSPFSVAARITNEEVEVGGQTIPRDQFLLVWLAAANRDPRQFPDPDAFDPNRHPNPQIAFGRGVHFCLGAPLARLEGKVALGILLDRFPALRTDPEDPPEFLTSNRMTGVRRLPLLLS